MTPDEADTAAKLIIQRRAHEFDNAAVLAQVASLIDLPAKLVQRGADGSKRRPRATTQRQDAGDRSAALSA